ncbi:Imm53 family immunity protein [Amycolatopsis sp. 195334CR]|uniref:Imm53 family immunity protein n=1 Tax=Amycolatopsis sp. 195334CR TaxID=2814588 RepID=UPI001A8CC65D|nr:hypothetical protein [Amycolatopsis sp. 195334CR]
MLISCRFLERWFAGQCDDDWEHRYGITLETRDNPGLGACRRPRRHEPCRIGGFLGNAQTGATRTGSTTGPLTPASGRVAERRTRTWHDRNGKTSRHIARLCPTTDYPNLDVLAPVGKTCKRVTFRAHYRSA